MSEGATPQARRPVFGQPGTLIGDRYRLRELVGSGGFGEVWRAEHEVQGESVRAIALKLLGAAPGGSEPGASPGDRSSAWLNEVRAVRELRCDEVPIVYDVGVTGERGLGFIAMELLHGETLEQRLERGPIHWRRSLAIARRIASALVACHRAGVIHCDLKPQNVFVTDAGRICVLDFGIAALCREAPRWQSALRRPHTASDHATAEVFPEEVPLARVSEQDNVRVVGTPGYIAPEAFAGDLPSPAADVYALGVVLYRMISGRLPYRLGADGGTSREEMDRYRAALSTAAIRGQLVGLQEAMPSVPRSVCALIDRMLSMAPESRPTAELDEALDDAWKRPFGVPDPPYVGLDSFGPEQAGFLAGRESDIAAITAQLTNTRAVVLTGPSGCGKSSLALAGVCARVDEQLVDGADGWEAVVVRPGRDLHAVDVAAQDGPGMPSRVGWIIVIDQLEEVLGMAEADRARFCAWVGALVEADRSVVLRGIRIAPGDRIRVVATVRDDLFGKVAALAELRRFPEQNLYVVRGVEPNALAAIVEGPALAAGYRMEGTEQVIDEARRVLTDDHTALPLVQFALARWWELRDRTSRTLPAAGWQDIGGVQGALVEAAQSIYQDLSSAERTDMQTLLVALFRPDGTRLQAAEDPLVAGMSSRTVLDRLVQQRLVRRLADSAQEGTLEVVHEALAQRWPLLRAWLEETRAKRELIIDLEADAARWHRSGRPAELLWRGRRLSDAQGLPDLEDAAVEFVSAATTGHRRARRLRRGVIGLLVGLLAAAAALALGYVASDRARQEAEEQRAAAEEARIAAATEQRRADEARDKELRTAERASKLADDAVALADQLKRRQAGGTGDDAGTAVDTKLAELTAEEAALDEKLGRLLEQQRGLLDGAGVDARENTLATRENTLATRENAVASRERMLAEREARLAQREREMAESGQTVIVQTVAPPSGSRYGKRDVEPLLSRARKTMSMKGLVRADLPPAAQGLEDEAIAEMRNGDYGKARVAAQQLVAMIDATVVGKPLVTAKFVRLNDAMKNRTLTDEVRAEVETLFQEATARYADGDFAGANQRLNRIFAALP